MSTDKKFLTESKLAYFITKCREVFAPLDVVTSNDAALNEYALDLENFYNTSLKFPPDEPLAEITEDTTNE